MNAVYLAVDNEAGGLDDCSLLTSYLAALDQDFNILADLSLTVRPNDGRYIVQGEGLGVNKINLVEHNKVAITYSEAGGRLREFLMQWSQNGQVKLMPFGHSVTGDVRELTTNLLNRGNLEQFVSHRVLDTSVIARFLQAVDLLPKTLSCGLSSLTTHFGIKHEPHEAKADVLATIAVFHALSHIVKGEHWHAHMRRPFAQGTEMLQ